MLAPQAPAKIVEQRANLGILGFEHGQFLRMGNSRRDVTAVAFERNQSQQNVPVGRMLLVRSLQRLPSPQRLNRWS